MDQSKERPGPWQYKKLKPVREVKQSDHLLTTTTATRTTTTTKTISKTTMTLSNTAELAYQLPKVSGQAHSNPIFIVPVYVDKYEQWKKGIIVH